MTLFEKLKPRCKRHLRGVIGHGNLRGKETEGETKRPQGGKEKEAELQEISKDSSYSVDEPLLNNEDDIDE